MHVSFASLVFRCTLIALGVAIAGAAPAETYQIAVIPKGTTQEYWRSVLAGAIKAKRELAAAGTTVEIIWKGPLLEDDREQQIQIVENFVGRKVSAILLAPLDASALAAAVEEAVRGGIPVIVIDSPLRSTLPASTVATDNREGGRRAARRLGQLLGGRGGVAMIRHQVGSASTESREAGFLEVMTSEFPGIKLVSVDQYGGPTRETAFTVAQNLFNRFGPRIGGIFAPDEATACGTLLALREQGQLGRVHFVAFDANDQLVGALRAGELEGLVVQDPFGIGYAGIKTAVAVLRHEKVPAVIETHSVLVMRETMDEAESVALLHPPLQEFRN